MVEPVKGNIYNLFDKNIFNGLENIVINTVIVSYNRGPRGEASCYLGGANTPPKICKNSD